MCEPTAVPSSRRPVPSPEPSAVTRRAAVVGVGATVAGGVVGLNRVADLQTGAASDRRRGDDPCVIAHRGFAGVYPENTVAAVRGAARGGTDDRDHRPADAVEIDVVPTGDGDLVVFHDSRLSGREDGGPTDAEGLVWERPTEVVTAAEVLDSGETVPLLTEALDAVPTDVGVNVELKNPGASDLAFDTKLDGAALEEQKDHWRPFSRSVLDVLDAYPHDVLLSSFYEAALATVREHSNRPVAPIVAASVGDGVEIARTYDAAAIHPSYDLVRGTPFYDPPEAAAGEDGAEVDLLGAARDQGLDVNVYTVTTSYQAEQLARAGVNGLIADYPGLLSGSRT